MQVEKIGQVRYNEKRHFHAEAFKENRTMGKKRFYFLFVLMVAMLLTACGESAKQEVTENTIIVGKDGKISGIIIEEFEKEYYDQAELSQMINEEISDYNSSGQQVTLEKLEVSGDQTYVRFQYETAEAYKGFNESELFVGTVSEAAGAGYEFTDMTSAKEGEAGLDAASVSGKGSMQVVIFEEPVKVRIPGQVAYVSEGVVPVGKKEVKASGEGGELFYVIYE